MSLKYRSSFLSILILPLALALAYYLQTKQLPALNFADSNYTQNTNLDNEMASSISRVSRSVVKSVFAVEQGEGAGAKVRRSIGSQQLRNFTPFLLLDHFRIAEGAGFPDHPHRGQATVTYMLDGQFQHEDFAGHKGLIGPGDLQWMQAGRGIVHAEMPVHGPGLPDPVGLQLWIDLPKDHKLDAPDYQELPASRIPTARPNPDAEIKVISGTSEHEGGEISSAVKPQGGCWYFDIKLTKKGAKVFQKIPKGWNSFIYSLDGKIAVGPEGSKSQQDAFYTIVLSNKQGANEEGVEVEALSDSGARFVLIAGEPLNQEIVQYGPFVMDTREGIEQAFMDYRMGKNGFEKAHSWRSQIGKSLM